MRIASLVLSLIILSVAIIVVFSSVSSQNPKATLHSTVAVTAGNDTDNVLTIQDETGGVFDVSVNDIPIYKAYLNSQEDIKTEIERTQFEMINTSTEDQFILLKYNCGNKQCSTLLLKIRNSEVTSLALANGIFQDYEISSEKDKMLMRYSYNEGGEVVRHILIGIDLLEMKVIPFESSKKAEEYMFTPTWPIVDYKWIDTKKVLIETADLESADYESVKNWYTSTDNKTKEIEVPISKTNRLDSYLTPY